jgi:hypothetical protein
MSLFICNCPPGNHTCPPCTCCAFKHDECKRHHVDFPFVAGQFMNGVPLRDMVDGPVRESMECKAQYEDIHNLVRYLMTSGRTRRNATKIATQMFTLIKECDKKENCGATIKVFFKKFRVKTELISILESIWGYTRADTIEGQGDYTYGCAFNTLCEYLTKVNYRHKGPPLFLYVVY